MKYLELAISLAKLSSKEKGVGCVIVRKNRILSIGQNTDKTHPTQFRLNSLRFNDNLDCCPHGQHAEFVAINNVKDKKKLKGCSIYVARVDKNGNTRPSFPCEACIHLIKKYNIKQIRCT